MDRERRKKVHFYFQQHVVQRQFQRHSFTRFYRGKADCDVILSRKMRMERDKQGRGRAKPYQKCLI